jgi:hypothetical protein
MEKPSKDRTDALSVAAYQINNGNLKNPKEVFDFLDSLNYFTDKDATEGFVDFIVEGCKIPLGAVMAGTRRMIMDKVKIMDQNCKFKTSKDIFEYLDNLGFFFNDSDGRTRCMHQMEQL